jgi:hypothetical protein
MRRAIYIGLTFILMLAVFPANALEPFALYDDFTGDRIDPNKWIARDITGGVLDAVRVVNHNRLHLRSRAYSNTTFTGGRNRGDVRLNLANANAITAMRAHLVVTGVDVVGCGEPTGTVTRMRGRIGGQFFNDGTSSGPGDSTGDLFVQMVVFRSSDSLDPPGVMGIFANLFHCGEPACIGGTTLFVDNVSFGTIRVGEVTRFTIQWDEPNNLFIFQRDRQPPVFAAYDPALNVAPPVGGKQLGIASEIENCAVAPRPEGSMNVVFDNVLVNESARPF